MSVRALERVSMVSAFVLLVSCGEGMSVKGAVAARSGVPELPDSVLAVDMTTPDRAIKSHWRINDLDLDQWTTPDSTLPIVRTLNSNVEKWKSARLKVLSGLALVSAKRDHVPETYSREILEVKQETESRAVVLARVKNITPIPPGAELTDFDKKRRRDGEVYRYIFEREGDGWKLVQIQSKDYKGDWDNQFDDRPYVPSLPSPY